MNTSNSKANEKTGLFKVILVLVIWFTAASAAAISGIWGRLPRFAFPACVLAGIFIPFLYYLKNPGFQARLRAVPIHLLSLFHVWRFPAGLYFLQLGANGLLPATFAHNAGYGDVTVGLASLVFIFHRPGKKAALAFQAISMADFIGAVGTGLTFTVLKVPGMANIQNFPVALIPGFGVGVTGALSLMTIHRLLRSSNPEDSSKV